ncbi:lytic polysaccharide monooxygenase [Atractiella rhizophila]|nr:lytic polysaccharide monooxygenase [Atractiella rhizophila]
MIFLPFLIFATSSAHMMLKTPVRYNFDDFDNFPLDAGGTNFPCKIAAGQYRQGEEARKENVFRAGENQTLSFTGSAVHGGGSCQISLTTDEFPDKKTQWSVIHSILGECPSNAPGNLPDDAFGNGADKFQFQIPKSVPSGNYTLAWTWFNKIGNREMYMNCAPITVTDGGDGNEEFPEMFIANLDPRLVPGNVDSCTSCCQTIEPTNLKFPDPGDYVDQRTSDLSDAKGSCPTTKRKKISGLAAVDSTSGTSASTTGETSTATASASQSVASAVTGTTTASSASASETSTSTVDSTSSNTTQPLLSNGCAPANLFNCLGTSFQRCTEELQWTGELELPAGLSCPPGLGMNMVLSPSSASARLKRMHKRRTRRLSRLL